MSVQEREHLFTEARAAEVKPRWGPGPWQDEPDRLQWWAHGLPCLALRGPFGQWNGYVGLRPGHPWYGQSCPDANVHGGLTWCGPADAVIGWVARGQDPRQAWWVVGFDCNHAGDYAPGLIAVMNSVGVRGTYHDDGHYWTLAEVRPQITDLARQAAAVEEERKEATHG